MVVPKTGQPGKWRLVVDLVEVNKRTELRAWSSSQLTHLVRAAILPVWTSFDHRLRRIRA
jgi:hypothetical protein